MGYLDLSDELVGADWDALQPAEGGAGLPAEGDYLWEIRSADDAPAKTGTPMLTLGVTVVANADGSESAEAGKSTFHRFFPQANRDKGANGLYGPKRLKHFLMAVGEDRRAFETEELIGRQFIGTCYHEQSQYEDENGQAKTSVNARIIKERSVETAAAEEVVEEEVQEAPPPPPKKATTPPAKAAAPTKAVNGKAPPPPSKGATKPQMQRR